VRGAARGRAGGRGIRLTAGTAFACSRGFLILFSRVGSVKLDRSIERFPSGPF
jgi:hypothetical protein